MPSLTISVYNNNIDWESLINDLILHDLPNKILQSITVCYFIENYTCIISESDISFYNNIINKNLILNILRRYFIPNSLAISWNDIPNNYINLTDFWDIQ